jgi:hypothetical protein
MVGRAVVPLGTIAGVAVLGQCVSQGRIELLNT